MRRHRRARSRRRAELDSPITTVWGIHAVETLLTRAPDRLRRLLLQRDSANPRLAALVTLAERAGIPVEQVGRDHLDRRAGAAHQGVMVECEPAPLAQEAELEFRWPQMRQPPLLLALDGVLDPRNLGACLRSADAARVDAVLLPRSRRAPLSGTARKAASGAAETLFIVEVANLARRLDWLRREGVRVIGAASEAQQRFTRADLRRPTAIVLGGEAGGLRRGTRERCDELVAIPMLGTVASLNVATAAALLLFEAVRQRSEGG